MKEMIRRALMEVLEDVGVFEEDFVLELETPKDAGHGDLTTNVALILAKRLGRKPRELAGELAAALDLDRQMVSSVEIAGPGFINFRLASGHWHRSLLEILEKGRSYGASDAGEGERVCLEFVSANPTGPLNIVSARAAAVGGALTRTLNRAGYRAQAEFYCNDAGRQVELLGQSLRARYAQARGIEGYSIPEEGYQGEYVAEMGRRLARQEGPPAPPSLQEDGVGRILGTLPPVEGEPEAWLGLSDEESARAFGRYALRALIAEQRQSCSRFGLSFDAWFLESHLHQTGRVESTLEKLRHNEHVYELAGALWFRSTDFGDEKDRVLVKADGAPTYFLSDIAYHASKHERGFERAVDFLGPDHHGHLARMMGAVQALGLPESWLEIIILQQVNLILDGQPLEMSKRAGRLVTMDQLVEEVGADVAKFFFLARKNASHLDFDLDLAKAESNENPVYYVKYAHARICSVLRNAEARGVDPELLHPEDLERLEHESERALLRLLPELPSAVARAAASLEMSRLTGFSVDVSAAFHQFYHQCTILGEDEILSRARLALCRATRIVLANTLELIGVEAPERM